MCNCNPFLGHYYSNNGARLTGGSWFDVLSTQFNAARANIGARCMFGFVPMQSFAFAAPNTHYAFNNDIFGNIVGEWHNHLAQSMGQNQQYGMWNTMGWYPSSSTGVVNGTVNGTVNGNLSDEQQELIEFAQNLSNGTEDDFKELKNALDASYDTPEAKYNAIKAVLNNPDEEVQKILKDYILENGKGLKYNNKELSELRSKIGFEENTALDAEMAKLKEEIESLAEDDENTDGTSVFGHLKLDTYSVLDVISSYNSAYTDKGLIELIDEKGNLAIEERKALVNKLVLEANAVSNEVKDNKDKEKLTELVKALQEDFSVENFNELYKHTRYYAAVNLDKKLNKKYGNVITALSANLFVDKTIEDLEGEGLELEIKKESNDEGNNNGTVNGSDAGGNSANNVTVTGTGDNGAVNTAVSNDNASSNATVKEYSQIRMDGNRTRELLQTDNIDGDNEKIKKWLGTVNEKNAIEFFQGYYYGNDSSKEWIIEGFAEKLIDDTNLEDTVIIATINKLIKNIEKDRPDINLQELKTAISDVNGYKLSDARPKSRAWSWTGCGTVYAEKIDKELKKVMKKLKPSS